MNRKRSDAGRKGRDLNRANAKQPSRYRQRDATTNRHARTERCETRVFHPWSAKTGVLDIHNARQTRDALCRELAESAQEPLVRRKDIREAGGCVLVRSFTRSRSLHTARPWPSTSSTFTALHSCPIARPRRRAPRPPPSPIPATSSRPAALSVPSSTRPAIHTGGRGHEYGRTRRARQAQRRVWLGDKPRRRGSSGESASSRGGEGSTRVVSMGARAWGNVEGWCESWAQWGRAAEGRYFSAGAGRAVRGLCAFSPCVSSRSCTSCLCSGWWAGRGGVLGSKARGPHPFDARAPTPTAGGARQDV
ncbi:hypothetical protein C8R44DRAFT_824733 [Mycena epipterygia]|nr:hypothetical protein C8R44DRAFT_824733 [Mycena epipterygia]